MSTGEPAEGAKHEVVFAKHINQEILGFASDWDSDVGFMKHVFPAFPAEHIEQRRPAGGGLLLTRVMSPAKNFALESLVLSATRARSA